MNVNIQPLLEKMPSASKDARRMGLFVAAVSLRMTQLSATNDERILSFLGATTSLVSRWIDRSRKFQFPIDFFRDPYRSLREETRAFAKEWELDPSFVKAMG